MARGSEDVLDQHHVVVAIDAPLGFPVAFQQLVAGRLPKDRPAERETDNPFAYRECERHVHAACQKKKPLSAPFDKLGNNATVALVYARAWAKQHHLLMLPFQAASEEASVIIEVYPALAKKRRTANCKKPWRSLLPKGLKQRTDDCDACLCALMALAFRSENAEVLPKLVGPNAGDEMSKREGWIYHPSPA